ncbi:MAG: DNA cytosine methyltransferase [Firmicutes bacterium]|nr:DNA cytosine methyltransferase [Bacillota bacterium]
MQKTKPKFTFVDLFAGIGGFHQALESLGGKCVAFSEINPECIKVYENNFPGVPKLGDIKKDWVKLPKFDMLCGGFPCQPFSKAGNQDGFNDKDRGNLFDTIVDILRAHDECKFLILENVRNLSDKTENWKYIQNKLKEFDFTVTEKPIVLSPCQFGIPQIRERVYILGIRKGIRDVKRLSNGFIHLEELGMLDTPPALGSLEIGDAWKILEENPDKKYYLNPDEVAILNIWDEFRKGTKYKPSHVPIWLDCFGYGLVNKEFSKKKFDYIFVEKVVNDQGEEIFRKKKTKGIISELPEWKQGFIKKNRKFYLEHKQFIDEWIEKYKMLERISIHKKFEWNCGKDLKTLKETIIQFRHSGIRAKRPTYFPALVAINNTPIIWDKSKRAYRYITPREAANLQSFKSNFKFSEHDSQTYKQLGNAVNVEIVKMLAEKLIGFAVKDWDKKEKK